MALAHNIFTPIYTTVFAHRCKLYAYAEQTTCSLSEGGSACISGLTG